jgi:NarL family two-component system response regulator LiaR
LIEDNRRLPHDSQAAEDAGCLLHLPGPDIDVPQLDEDKRAPDGHRVPVDLIKVFLVDDQEMLTEALTAWLSDAPDVWVLGRSTVDDAQLLLAIARLRPDVITIEVEPLGTATFEVLVGLRSAWPAARIVVLTSAHDAQRAVEAARAGAIAWVPKEAPAEEFLGVLRAVALDGACYPPAELGAILRALTAEGSASGLPGSQLDVLTSRERTVLAGMVDGLRGSEIAAALHMSKNTVRTHTNSIFAKLQAHSRVEAISIARAAGVLPQDHPMWS